MSLGACIARLEAEGTIDAERAARFTTEYDRLNKAYRKTMGQAQAAQQATLDTLDALEYDAALQRQQKLAQINVQRGLLTGFAEHIESGRKAGHFLAGIMDAHAGTRGMSSVSNRRAAIGNLSWSRMDGFVGRFKRNMLGVVSNRAELQDVARHLRGEAIDNPNAKLIGDAVADTFEWLRVQYNKAGGAIPKLKNWGMPQSHDAQLIAKAGLQEWKDFIRPLLNPAEMIDNSTGKAFADVDAMDEALDAAWRNIATEGMDGAVPGAFTGKGKMANRRADHRFLIFKDTDSWIAYNEKFGMGDLFDAITGHIDSMSRDIAAMEILGPNPALTIRWLSDIAQMDALPTMENGVAPKLSADAKDGADLMDRMWRYYTGELTQPHSRAVARFWSGARNWNVATKLGRAFISAAFTDPMWAATNAKFNGLSQFKAMANYVGAFNPLDASHREAARHAGIVVHELTSRSEKMWREGAAMKFNLHELTRRSADFVLRSTLLTPSTVAWKESAALGWFKDWADNADKGWGDLGDGQRLSFERYGISEGDWDLLRSTGIEDGNGIDILRPGDLARRTDIDPDLAIKSAVKFFELIDGESKQRVVGEGLRAQTAAITLGGTAEFKKGTMLGEAALSATQFKTFGIAALINTWNRTLHAEGGISPTSFAMRTIIGVTLGGMLAEQMIQISDGKDPLPWDETLLARGFARGGGMGIIGDVLSQGVSNDRGQTVAGIVTGPTLSSVVDPAFNLTLGNAGELARGEDTNVQREAVRFVKGQMPGGNAWYGKLAFNRLLMDELEALADPDIEQLHKRQMKTAKDQGTEFWWAPGDDAPVRAPDLTPTLGDSADETQGSMLQ